MSTEYCCGRFKSLIANAGKRGLALLATRIAENIAISLQSRGVAHADVDKILPEGGEYDINIATDFVIAYCPDCGSKIDSLILANRSFFEHLADSRKNLLAENFRKRTQFPQIRIKAPWGMRRTDLLECRREDGARDGAHVRDIG